MEIRYTPSVKDLSAFQRYWVGRLNRRTRKKHWLIALGLAVVLVPLTIIYIEEIWALNPMEWLTHLIVLLVGLVVVMACLQLMTTRQFAKATGGEMLVSLTEAGLHHDDQVTRSVTDWSALEAIHQTKGHIIICYGFVRGLAIPLTALRARRPRMRY